MEGICTIMRWGYLPASDGAREGGEASFIMEQLYEASHRTNLPSADEGFPCPKCAGGVRGGKLRDGNRGRRPYLFSPEGNEGWEHSPRRS